MLRPDQPYDRDGVFTGCMAPFTTTTTTTTTTGAVQLMVVYSSIRKLPFHWSTPPYPRNAAGLALAISRDGGNTWEKSQHNPILPGEPEGVNVTGFRDPYMARWPAVDLLLGYDEAKVYGLVSGGIDCSGPTTFLYEIQPSDATKWEYLGPLVDVPLNFQPSDKWSGNYGINWECVNFLSFKDGSASKHFLLIGAEGGIERNHIKSDDLTTCLSPRTVRTQVWMSGSLMNKEGVIKLLYQYGGYLDHGSYYAANSFHDRRSGRYIVHGWIPEEDITPDHAQQKGWNGSLAIPREAFLLTVPAVAHALRSPLSEISCVEAELRQDGLYDLHTLGVKPISEVDQFRTTCRNLSQTSTPILLPRSKDERRHCLYSTVSSTWELEATISLKPQCDTVGFHIRHNHDLSISTTITFSALAENITVGRASSNDAADINKCPELGAFTLFTARQRTGSGSDEIELKQEPLHLRIFSDGDVLEIFANDRFALATMVYSHSQTDGCSGITAFATGEIDSAVFESVSIWDGLNGDRSVVIDELDRQT